MMKNTCNIFRKSAYKILMFIGTHQDRTLTFQTQIANELDMKITTVNYHITKFKQEGLIKEDLKLTEKGFKAFKFLWENENKKVLRAHNIQVKFNVIKCPSSFPLCFSKSIYQPLTNNKYRGLKTKLNGFTVMFYSPKKIVCVLPDIYGDNNEEISSTVQLLIPQLKEILENEFQGIKTDNYELAKIQTMHIAVLNSVIAKSYLLKGFTYEGKDTAIDNSKGKPENEATNPSTALNNIEELMEKEEKQRGKKLISESI